MAVDEEVGVNWTILHLVGFMATFFGILLLAAVVRATAWSNIAWTAIGAGLMAGGVGMLVYRATSQPTSR